MSPLKIANLAENTLETLLLISVFCQVNILKIFTQKYLLRAPPIPEIKKSL